MRYLFILVFILGCDDGPLYSDSDPIEEIRHAGTDVDTDTDVDTGVDTVSPPETDTGLALATSTGTAPDISTETETDTGVVTVDTVVATETETETETEIGRLVEVPGLMGGSPRQQCFFDFELGIFCCPFLTEDLMRRCLPAYHTRGGNQSYYFADMCDDRLLAILDKPDAEHEFFDPEIDPSLKPDFILSPNHDDEGLYLFSVFGTGDQFFEGMVYNGLFGCQAVILSESQRAPYYYFEYGPQVDLSIFAEIQ